MRQGYGAWASFCVVLFCLAIVSVGAGQAPSNAEVSQTPSKAEVKAGVVRSAHELESKPLDAIETKETKAALVWAMSGDDLHSTICLHVLGDFYSSKYKHSPIVTSQLVLSSAAFMIENPEKADDKVAVDLAGVEGVLKAYSSILREKPKDKSKPLDELAQKQGDGKLAEFVKDVVEGKNCGPTIKLGK